MTCAEQPHFDVGAAHHDGLSGLFGHMSGELAEFETGGVIVAFPCQGP